ncbi:MAG: hypothetical protein ABSH49_04030 [Bryobacteraceae bacterium]|jgi:hypothetical protein
MQFGGPMGALLGAGMGAAAGFGIGLGEKLAGIKSPAIKAANDIKQIYGVDIPENSGTIKQVVGIAQSQFGGDIAVAVRSPNVRQLVMLYSKATDQKMPLSASTPYAGSLVEQGGNLYQQASFQNMERRARRSARFMRIFIAIGLVTAGTTPTPPILRFRGNSPISWAQSAALTILFPSRTTPRPTEPTLLRRTIWLPSTTSLRYCIRGLTVPDSRSWSSEHRLLSPLRRI